MPELSVVIATYNEADHIAALVEQLRQYAPAGELVEILVVDAHSSDGTAALAEAAGATVIHTPYPSRAAQMNYGAAHARHHTASKNGVMLSGVEASLPRS